MPSRVGMQFLAEWENLFNERPAQWLARTFRKTKPSLSDLEAAIVAEYVKVYKERPCESYQKVLRRFARGFWVGGVDA